MTTCKFCGLKIFFVNVDGRPLPFEDQNGTVYHDCPKLKKYQQQNNDHNLLTKTITRVSQLETLVEELKKKLM